MTLGLLESEVKNNLREHYTVNRFVPGFHRPMKRNWLTHEIEGDCCNMIFLSNINVETFR